MYTIVYNGTFNICSWGIPFGEKFHLSSAGCYSARCGLDAPDSDLAQDRLGTTNTTCLNKGRVHAELPLRGPLQPAGLQRHGHPAEAIPKNEQIITNKQISIPVNCYYCYYYYYY